MRPAIAFLIWVVLIGGLAAYMHTRAKVAAGPVVDFKHARGDFALELTTTFDLEPDPFALRTDSGSAAPALVVLVNGKEALRRTDKLARGTPILVEPVPYLVQGRNEIYVEANPPVDSAGQSLAVRVRLMEGGRPLVDRSFWSEEGTKVASSFSVDVQAGKTADETHHGH